jgi:hypothetical protein
MTISVVWDAENGIGHLRTITRASQNTEAFIDAARVSNCGLNLSLVERLSGALRLRYTFK